MTMGSLTMKNRLLRRQRGPTRTGFKLCRRPNWIFCWFSLVGGLVYHLACYQPLVFHRDDLLLLDYRNSKRKKVVCNEDPFWANVTRRIPDDRNFLLSLAGPGSENITTNAVHAVCELRISGHTIHFPHTMQQLYQCWSFWNLSKNAHKQRILIIPPNAKGFAGEKLNLRDVWYKLRSRNWNGYLDGFIAFLRDAGNVTVLRNSDNSGTLLPVWRADRDHTFLMHSSDDVRALKATIVQHYAINATDGCQNNMPRIAIVHREKSRSIVNEAAIVDMIHSELELNENLRIGSFDSATFLDQVEFFANADILISPHGAELTNIPFLPSCGRVLEIFPAFYYYNMYFGSLADVSNIASYPLYLSKGDPETEWAYAHALTSVQRRRYRNVNLCPPVNVVRDAIRLMMEDWRRCCEASQS